MAMFITQETFDEVVKENMEDFGMDRRSAAEDAVGQFKAQGEQQFPPVHYGAAAVRPFSVPPLRTIEVHAAVMSRFSRTLRLEPFCTREE